MADKFYKVLPVYEIRGPEKPATPLEKRNASIELQRKLEKLTLTDSTGHDVNERDSNGWTALQMAVAAKNLKAVEQLLLLDPSAVDFESFEGSTALALAVKAGCVALVELLVRYGADVHRQLVDYINDGKSFGYLHAAVYYDQVQVVKTLLKLNVNVNEPDSNEITPLHVSSCYGFFETTKILLEHGADLHDESSTCYPDYKHTALVTSVIMGHKNLFHLLLENGASLSDTDELGASLLHIAIQNDQSRLARHLIVNFHVNVNALTFDRSAMTPLHYAVKRCNLDLVQFLLLHGADPNIPCSTGDTTLHYAVAVQHPNICRLLLQHNADVHIKNNTGNTALHVAVTYDSTEAVLLLLHYGAEVRARNRLSLTPLDLALSSKHRSIRRQCVSLFMGTECLKDIYASDINGRHQKKLLHEYALYMIRNQVAKLYIRNGHTEDADKQRSNISNFNIDCAEEVKKLKKIRLHNKKNMYDFMAIRSKCVLRSYTKNKTFCRIFKNNVNTRSFPIYEKILSWNYILGKIYENIYDVIIEILNDIFPISLPVPLLDKIIDDFGIEDIRKLMKCRLQSENNAVKKQLISKLTS